jgi:hypothetical protein
LDLAKQVKNLDFFFFFFFLLFFCLFLFRMSRLQMQQKAYHRGTWTLLVAMAGRCIDTGEVRACFTGRSATTIL